MRDTPTLLVAEQDFKRLVLAGRVYSIARRQWRKIDDLGPPPVAVVRPGLLGEDFASEVTAADLCELSGAQTDYMDTFLLVLRGAVMDEVPFHTESGVTMPEVYKECLQFFVRHAPRPIVRRMMIAPVIDRAINDITMAVDAWKTNRPDFTMLWEGMMEVSRRSDSLRAGGRRYVPKRQLDQETLKALTQTTPVREVSLSEDD